MALIEIDKLEVVFGKGVKTLHALKGVSLSVESGESYGLVGESGSGKSTVLRAICGLNQVHSGTIKLNGKEIKSPRNNEFYRDVQMVFQDPYGSLHPRQTVDRALSEPLIIHGFKDVQERVVKALDEVGLGKGFRFRYPHQLSGGQRQRIAIARALILEPKILLLDEPTSALDASIQAEILNLLDSLRKERQLTYLMVSHDLAVVAHMCDRLTVMQHGKAVEVLTRETLRKHQTKALYTQDLLKASEGFTRA